MLDHADMDAQQSPLRRVEFEWAKSNHGGLWSIPRVFPANAPDFDVTADAGCRQQLARRERR